MTALQANCPSCGASLSFKSGSSIVLICDYCRSVVARTDRALEDLGRVAEIAETGSPLDLGLRGRYRGVSFELTGRAQLGHAAGGMWDEWYAALSDGRWGWLAEAQGRFYLTFQQTWPQANTIPPLDELALGRPVAAIPGSVPMVVAEKGEARMLGAKGEIPYRLVPGETYAYADLSGQGGAFGTIDYGETPPLIFLGEEVTLAELGLTGRERAPEREARAVAAASLSCPNCGGGLELRAPDHTERVTCPNCNSLLDVNQGQLKFLKALKPGKFQPVIPIGAVGEFEGGKLTVIGAMQRSVNIEGTRYFWEEYLLYHPQAGFRWLVRSDDHWNFVQSVAPGDVLEIGSTAQFRGDSFRLFQDAPTLVEHVVGEFYWKVIVGEKVQAADYVRPPRMLSKEVPLIYMEEGKKKRQPSATVAEEINWSLGTYVKPQEVEKAFGIEGLPRPSNVAPNQPFPHRGLYKYWGIFLLILLLVAALSTVINSSNRVLSERYQLPPLANEDGTQVVFSDPFQLEGRRTIRVEAQSPVDNSWLYMEGDFVNEQTGLVQTFSVPIEYYHGVEDGESWNEGGQSKAVHLSALPAGTYTMRLEAQWEKWQQPAVLTVIVDQGRSSGFNLLAALIALSIIPVLVFIWQRSFERRRWSESMFGGGSD